MYDQILMGSGVAVVCAAGLWHDRWFLENTRKGQRLVRWFGDGTALWILRSLLSAGVVFGLLLAVGIVRPVQWDSREESGTPGASRGTDGF